MKLSIAFAIIPFIGSAYAAPASANSLVQRDGKDSGKPVEKPHHEKDKDYDWSKDKSHYPDNLWCYPNKHCDVRYQNFLDLLLDDVCARFYNGDKKHKDKEWDDDKKHKRDGKDYGGDHGKKDDHKPVEKCDDRADELLDEACRAYYHYKPKDDGKKDHDKDHGKDHGKDEGKGGGKKDEGKGGEHKDDGKKPDGQY